MSPPPPSPPIWRSKDVPRGNLFLGERTNAPRSRSSQKCDVSVVLAVTMSIWIDRWRKISKSAINELPEGNNFGERILFSLFSARSSLSCPSIIPHYWQRQQKQQQQVQKLLAEKGGSIGNDAFCPVMNYGPRRTTISRDAAVGGSGGGSVEQNDSFDQFSKLTQQEAPFSHFDFSLSPLSSLS